MMFQYLDGTGKLTSLLGRRRRLSRFRACPRDGQAASNPPRKLRGGRSEALT